MRPALKDITCRTRVLKSYWEQYILITLDNGVLKQILENFDGAIQKKYQLFSTCYKAEVLKQFHDNAA